MNKQNSFHRLPPGFTDLRIQNQELMNKFGIVPRQTVGQQNKIHIKKSQDYQMQSSKKILNKNDLSSNSKQYNKIQSTLHKDLSGLMPNFNVLREKNEINSKKTSNDRLNSIQQLNKKIKTLLQKNPSQVSLNYRQRYSLNIKDLKQQKKSQRLKAVNNNYSEKSQDFKQSQDSSQWDISFVQKRGRQLPAFYVHLDKAQTTGRSSYHTRSSHNDIKDNFNFIVNKIRQQVKLDSILRQKKRNLQIKVQSGKYYKQMINLLRIKGFYNIQEQQLNQIFLPICQEYDPFIQTTQCDTIEQLVQSYCKAQQHYQKEVKNNFGAYQVSEMIKKMSIKKQQIAVQDLVRLLNMKESGYRNRDVYLIYKRFKNNKESISLSLQQFKTCLTK